MPNWVKNELVVTAPTPEELQAFRDAARSEDKPLSFHSTVPCTDSDWYGERNRKWGVKWDARNATEQSPGVYTFTTAWSYPSLWYFRTALQYPRLVFKARFWGETDFPGVRYIANGFTQEGDSFAKLRGAHPVSQVLNVIGAIIDAQITFEEVRCGAKLEDLAAAYARRDGAAILDCLEEAERIKGNAERELLATEE